RDRRRPHRPAGRRPRRDPAAAVRAAPAARRPAPAGPRRADRRRPPVLRHGDGADGAGRGPPDVPAVLPGAARPADRRPDPDRAAQHVPRDPPGDRPERAARGPRRLPPARRPPRAAGRRLAPGRPRLHQRHHAERRDGAHRGEPAGPRDRRRPRPRRRLDDDHAAPAGGPAMTMTPPRGTPAGTAPPPAPSARRTAEPQRPRGGRLRAFARGRWLRTIPGRIGVHVVLCLAAIAALLAVLTVAIGNARDSVQAIGHDAGPQVVATGTLYFALSDMDAQVSNVLLIGRDHDLGIGHDESLRLYERRRAEADAAAVQAAQLAGGDPALRRTVQEVLDGLGRYERLVGRAMELDRQAAHPPGELPKQVVDAYREATDLMKLELLPKAYNITLDTGAQVRQDYETKRSAVLTGRSWVAVTGLVALLFLVATQLYLTRTFRRVLNPPLVLATLAALALTAAGAGLLTAQAGHMR